MGTGGRTAASQVSQLVDMEAVVAGSQTLDEDRDVGGFCAGCLVECDITSDARISDGQDGDALYWLHRLSGEEEVQLVTVL